MNKKTFIITLSLVFVNLNYAVSPGQLRKQQEQLQLLRPTQQIVAEQPSRTIVPPSKQTATQPRVATARTPQLQQKVLPTPFTQLKSQIIQITQDIRAALKQPNSNFLSFDAKRTEIDQTYKQAEAQLSIQEQDMLEQLYHEMLRELANGIFNQLTKALTVFNIPLERQITEVTALTKSGTESQTTFIQKATATHLQDYTKHIQQAERILNSDIIPVSNLTEEYIEYAQSNVRDNYTSAVNQSLTLISNLVEKWEIYFKQSFAPTIAPIEFAQAKNIKQLFIDAIFDNVILSLMHMWELLVSVSTIPETPASNMLLSQLDDIQAILFAANPPAIKPDQAVQTELDLLKKMQQHIDSYKKNFSDAQFNQWAQQSQDFIQSLKKSDPAFATQMEGIVRKKREKRAKKSSALAQTITKSPSDRAQKQVQDIIKNLQQLETNINKNSPSGTQFVSFTVFDQSLNAAFKAFNDIEPLLNDQQINQINSAYTKTSQALSRMVLQQAILALKNATSLLKNDHESLKSSQNRPENLTSAASVSLSTLQNNSTKIDELITRGVIQEHSLTFAPSIMDYALPDQLASFTNAINTFLQQVHQNLQLSQQIATQTIRGYIANKAAGEQNRLVETTQTHFIQLIVEVWARSAIAVIDALNRTELQIAPALTDVATITNYIIALEDALTNLATTPTLQAAPKTTTQQPLVTSPARSLSPVMQQQRTLEQLEDITEQEVIDLKAELDKHLTERPGNASQQVRWNQKAQQLIGQLEAFNKAEAQVYKEAVQKINTQPTFVAPIKPALK